MEARSLVKAAMLALVLVAGFTLWLEMYWRGRGFVPSFNDDKILWATKRKQVYKPADSATVFIGGSRIKFDLDVATWKKFSGEDAIQLAIVGTPARIILRDLANDENFKGKLIIDVAEPQFFTMDSVRRDRFAREALEYYYDETPAQEISAVIGYLLESNFVFLKEGKFGLVSLLNSVPLKNRPGALFFRPNFPKEFTTSNFDRQTSMTPMFLSSDRLKKLQIENWKRGFALNKPLKAGELDVLLAEYKKYIDKVRSRGGSVVFVRPPSTNGYLEIENLNYSRKEYWDYLLKYTNSFGIHFSDYPAISKFDCPEWSHLAPPDAVRYTQQLVRILQEEAGWKFANTEKSISKFNH
jgi:hypothetical protein